MIRKFRYEGIKHPLIEAEYDTAFRVYQADNKKAVIGHPNQCIEAKGLKRLDNVEFAHISSGRHAYVGFVDTNSPTGITVRHFTIPTKAAEVRDSFDTENPPKTQILMLKTPKSQKLDHLAMLGKRRREEIKHGAIVKPRGPQKKKRIVRLGVPPRPQANIIKEDE
jgi:hypothetical protein